MADKFISASDLLKMLGIDPDGDCDNCSRWGRFGCESTEMQKVCLTIYECHAADVRPVVRATWTPYPFMDDMRIKHYSCSVCKRVVFIPHGRDVEKEMPYCHCGADMRPREEAKP